MGLQKRITLREYVRPGWTYHAKGLWYTLPNERKPTLTFIGSSNFGERNVYYRNFDIIVHNNNNKKNFLNLYQVIVL